MKKFKQWMLLIPILAMCVIFVPMRAGAAETSGSCGESATWTYNNGTLTVSGTGIVTSKPGEEYKTSITKIIFDEGIAGFTEEINEMFVDYTVLSEVEFLGDDTTLVSNLFGDCKKLSKIRLPGRLKTIPVYCFGYCGALTEITIPDSVTLIDSRAFEVCEGLKSVTFPKNLQTIGQAAFNACSSLQSVTLPEGVTSIGNQGFFRNYALSSLSLPSTLESIGRAAFKDCTSLKKIVVPRSVTTIGNTALGFSWDALNASDVKISGVTIYGFEGSAAQTYAKNSGISFKVNGAYCGYDDREDEAPEENAWWTYDYDTRGLVISGTGWTRIFEQPTGSTSYWSELGISPTSAVVEEGITELGWYTLAGCTELKSVTLPSTLQSIEGAFEDCSKLAGIQLPGNLRDISQYAFARCTSLASIEIPSSCYSVGYLAFSGCTALTKVVLHDGLYGISQQAFTDCTALKEIEIPATVTSIGYQGLGYYYTSNDSKVLPGFSISGRKYTVAETYAKENGIPFNVIGEYYDFSFDPQTGMLTVSGNCPIYDMPDTDSEKDMPWGEYADEITEIVIEEGITAIGMNAFSGLKNLVKVTVPGTVKTIGVSAFYECGNLTEVSLAAGLETIDSVAFGDCKALKKIVIPATVTEIGSSCFEGASALSDILLPEGLIYLDWYAFAGCTSLKEITFPSTLINNEEDLFSFGPLADSYVEKVTFAKGTTVLPYGICYGASRLKEVVIPDTVTHFGEYVFYDCSSLETLDIPETVTSIDQFAFGYCKAMTGLTLPSGLQEISYGLFAGCESLDHIVIPEGVKKIGEIAFAECKNLRSVILPEGLKWIEKTVFANCPKLAKLRIPDSVTNLTENACGYTCRYNSDTQSYDITGKEEDFTIYGSPLSAAYFYASENGFKFVDVTSEGLTAEYFVVDLTYGDLVYSGEAYTPGVTVFWVDPETTDAIPLEEDIDYKLTYSDNVAAGEAKVTLTGLNEFYGEKVETFTIEPLSIAPTVKLKNTTYTYDGKVKKPAVTVSAPSLSLKEGTDYTVKYASGRKNPGKYTVTVSGTGNYTFKVSKSFTINPKGTTLSGVTPAKKAFTVKWKKQATQTTGYQIQYATNSKFTAGKKTVTVKSKKTVSKKITGLKAKKKYYVRIRTYKTVGGTKYYSAWSAKKAVTTKK